MARLYEYHFSMEVLLAMMGIASAIFEEDEEEAEEVALQLGFHLQVELVRLILNSSKWRERGRRQLC